MTKPNDGGPAFPLPAVPDRDGGYHPAGIWKEYIQTSGGMSLRTYAAIEMLKGILSHHGQPTGQSSDLVSTRQLDVQVAISYADALLDALS